jgi:hypothetical protein
MAESRAATFLLGGFPVTRLEDDYYCCSDTECDICRTDREADSPKTEEDPENNLNAIPRTSVVKTSVCCHDFHEVCLVSWIHSQIQEQLHGTCPKCRGELLFNPSAMDENTEPDTIIVANELDTYQHRLHDMREFVRRREEENLRLEALILEMRATVQRARQRNSIRVGEQYHNMGNAITTDSSAGR